MSTRDRGKIIFDDATWWLLEKELDGFTLDLVLVLALTLLLLVAH